MHPVQSEYRMTSKQTVESNHMASVIVKNYFNDRKIDTLATSSFALCCVYDKDFKNDWMKLHEQMSSVQLMRKKLWPCVYL